MSEEQKQQPTFSEVVSEVSSTVFETDPIPDCDCPARRKFEPAVVLAPDQHFDEWKSRRSQRHYHAEVGVKHSWGSKGQTWSTLHYLDKSD